MVVIIIKYIKSEDFIMNPILLLLCNAAYYLLISWPWMGQGTAAGYCRRLLDNLSK
jgi:hypothetical protein